MRRQTVLWCQACDDDFEDYDGDADYDAHADDNNADADADADAYVNVVKRRSTAVKSTTRPLLS